MQAMEQRLKSILAALAVLGLSIFTLNLLVDNPYTHRLVRTALNKKVASATNLMVDFKAIKVRVVPPSLDLYGVYMAPANTPKSPLLTLSHARARLSLWALVLGGFRLAKVEADDLSVAWPPPWDFPGFLRDDGQSEEPKGPVEWPPKFDLPIDRIALKNAQVVSELPLFSLPERAKFLSVQGAGIDLDVSYRSWQDLTLAIEARSLDLGIGASSLLEETRLAGNFALQENHVVINNLALNGERINLDLAGGLELITKATDGQKGRSAKKSQELMALSIVSHAKVQGSLSLLGSFLDLPETNGDVVGETDIKVNMPLSGQKSPEFLVSGAGKVASGRLSGFRLFESEAKFKVTPDLVAFPELKVVIGDKTFAAGKGEIKLNDQVDFDFAASPTNLQLSDLLGALKVGFDQVDTALSSPNLRVFGRADPFQLNVTSLVQASKVNLPIVDYDHSRFPVEPACRLNLRLKVTEQALDFDGTEGNCYDPGNAATLSQQPQSTTPPANANAISPVKLGGLILLSDARTTLDLKVQSSELDLALGQYFAQQPLAGTAQLRTHIHGDAAHVLIDNEVLADRVRVRGMPFGLVQAKVRVDGKTVLWHDLKAELPAQAQLPAPAAESRHAPKGGIILSPEGHLDVTNEPYRIGFKAQAKDLASEAVKGILAEVAPDLQLAIGVSSLDGDFEGPLFHPGLGQGQLQFVLVDGQSVGGRLFDRFEGKIVGTSKGFETSGVSLSLGSLVLAAKLKHERAPDFSVQDARAGATDTLTALGISHKDKLDIEINTLPVSDRRAAPHERAEKPTARDLPKADPMGKSSLDASGHLPQDDHLKLLPFAGAVFKEARISGLLTVKVQVTGTPLALQGTFATKVDHLSLLGANLAPLEAKGFIKGTRLDGVLHQGGSALEGRIALDLGQDDVPYEWFFSFNRLDLRPLGTDYFYGDARNYAYLTGEWRMKGRLGDFWRSTGELKIADLRGKFHQNIAGESRPIWVQQEKPATILFTEQGWRFEGDHDLYLSGRNLQLRLSLDKSRPPGRLGIRVESVLDMAFAKDFLPEVDTAEGKIKVLAEVLGPTSDPGPKVEVTDLKPNPFIPSWRPISFGLADVRPPFKNLRFRLVYQGGKLVIDRFTADKGAGHLSATGSLNLAGPPNEDSRIDCTLNDATIIFPAPFLKSFETQISGNVVLSGNSLPFRIAGDIVINKARSTREVDIRDEIINALRQKSFSTTLVAEKPTFIFDLNISGSESINIHNRNVQGVLSANLHLKGTDIAPQVVGQVEVDKGKFIYKRDFTITRGLVTFDDPVKPDPSLDLLAVSEVDLYRVYIAVTGKASNPKIAFTVDPPTRESGAAISDLEILVLLSRGKLPDESRSNGQDLTNAAASEAATLLLGQFEEPVEKLLDASGQNFVRNVYIDTHPSTDPERLGTPVPRLNLPLDLGGDVDFVFRTDQDTSEVSLEYNVNENIYFSGVREFPPRNREQPTSTQSTGATPVPIDGDAKVNLKFRFSFE